MIANKGYLSFFSTCCLVKKALRARLSHLFCRLNKPSSSGLQMSDKANAEPHVTYLNGRFPQRSWRNKGILSVK